MLLKRIANKLKREILKVFDFRLFWTEPVFNKSNKKIFVVYDHGEICRFRASSFLTKEPETLDWIDTFDSGDNFLDIGANIGIYSLYAATKGIQTTCVEPDALNFALLNLNIKKNRLGHLTKAFPVALNDTTGFFDLNLQKMQWGGALSSFNNQKDVFEKTFEPVHKQGCFGETLDNFTSSIGLNVNHIKIDVDGNENLILKNGTKTLQKEGLKSLLIELDEKRKDYESSIAIIEASGLKLVIKTHSEMFDNSKFSSLYNHIFRK